MNTTMATSNDYQTFINLARKSLIFLGFRSHNRYSNSNLRPVTKVKNKFLDLIISGLFPSYRYREVSVQIVMILGFKITFFTK